MGKTRQLKQLTDGSLPHFKAKHRVSHTAIYFYFYFFYLKIN